MAKLPRDFADLLIELSEAEAEFLLIGGWAVVLHGHVRATDDMDVFVRPTPENSIRVVAALSAFGAPVSAHGVGEHYFSKPGSAYRFGVAPFKIEVLSMISGVTFDEALEGSQTFELDGYEVPYIGREALIRNKRSSARHKDLADIEELERLPK